MNVLDVTGATLAEAAVEYARAGLAIFPLDTNKMPLQTVQPAAPSQLGATTDAELVAEWWERWPTSLIGHRVTAGQLLIDIDPRHHGDDTWRALVDAYGRPPATRAHYSGRNDGGGHIWLRAPLEVGERYRTTALDLWAREHDLGEAIAEGRRWTAGIDLLHHGHRYTILPPSPHPDTGQPYRWKGDGIDTEIADIPGWLRTYVIDREPERPLQPAANGTNGDGIIAWYKANHRIGDLLASAGWQLVGGNGDDNGSKWRHPNATTPVSATVTDGSLYVYSPNTVFEPTYPSDPHGYDVFDLYAELHHRGDRSAAARAAVEQRDGPRVEVDLAGLIAVDPVAVEAAQTELADQLENHGWHPSDVAAVLAEGWQPPIPTLFARPDGKHLLYAGRVNGFFGESASGKSWMAMHVAAEVIADGGTVLYIDLEDHLASVAARMLALGVDGGAVADQFHYIAPEAPYSPVARVYIERLVDEYGYALVVIDSTGEAMALDGAKQNDDDAVAQWHRKLPRAIAHLGPCVVLIDHVPKASDAPANYSIGSQRKRAAIDGALYRVDPIRHPAKGHRGEIKLTCAKDRNGTYTVGQPVANVVVDANLEGSTVDIRVQVPTTVDRPTELMERVSRYLETHPGATQRTVCEDVKGKTDYVRKALDVLVADRLVRVERQGQAMVHYVDTPFRRDELDELIPNRKDTGDNEAA